MTDPRHESLLSSEPVFLGKLLKVYQDTIQLPGGATAIREIVRHPGAVAMVPLTGENAVMLVRQFRGAARRALLEIPAGTLEPGEDPIQAAARELQEEIGCKPGCLERLGGEYTAPGYTTEYITFFLATGLEPSRLAADADEQIEIVTLPFDEALRQVMAGEIEDGKTIAALLLTARRLGR